MRRDGAPAGRPRPGGVVASDRVPADALPDRFALPRTYPDESHRRSYLLECRSCGQLSLYRLKEEVGWSFGHDGPHVTRVPVADAEAAQLIDAAGPSSVHSAFPRRVIDRPLERRGETVERHPAPSPDATPSLSGMRS